MANNKDTVGRNIPVAIFVSMLLVLVGAVGIAWNACGDDTPPPAVEAPASKSQAQPVKTHVVRRGEFIRSIAPQYGVGWEAVLLANEKFLQASYDKTCGGKPESYTNNPRRSGLFCNNRYGRAYGNTLMPGWSLAIPSAATSVPANAVVGDIQGRRIALVIDDTGSMNEDRQRVSQFYLAAIEQYEEKELTGVWLYADDRLRKYEAGEVKFLTDGNTENTFGALQAAAETKPDVIILVTDEEGNDWDWSRVDSLPPVIAHCLPDNGVNLCKVNLERVAKATGGRYVEGLGK